MEDLGQAARVLQESLPFRVGEQAPLKPSDSVIHPPENLADLAAGGFVEIANMEKLRRKQQAQHSRRCWSSQLLAGAPHWRQGGRAERQFSMNLSPACVSFTDPKRGTYTHVTVATRSLKPSAGP